MTFGTIRPVDYENVFLSKFDIMCGNLAKQCEMIDVYRNAAMMS